MKLLIISFTAILLMQQSIDKITVDVRLQQVVATVRDDTGKIVKGLHKEDLIVEDGRVRQDIVHFSDDPDAPVSLGILIDSTGSMGKMPGGTESGLAAATAITRILLRYLKPDDEVLVMTFSRSFVVKQNFTSDHRKLEKALTEVQVDGTTDVLKAIGPALQQVRKARYPRRALLLMTDAYFSGDLKQVAGTVSQAEVPIFALAMRGVDFGPTVRYCTSACHAFETLPPLQDPRHGPFVDPYPNHTKPFLDTLANESGGRSTIFELDPRNTMQRINAQIEDIAAELRGQYLLGYYPGSSTSGTIRVRTMIATHRVHIRREDQLLTKPPLQ